MTKGLDYLSWVLIAILVQPTSRVATIYIDTSICHDITWRDMACHPAMPVSVVHKYLVGIYLSNSRGNMVEMQYEQLVSLPNAKSKAWEYLGFVGDSNYSCSYLFLETSCSYCISTTIIVKDLTTFSWHIVTLHDVKFSYVMAAHPEVGYVTQIVIRIRAPIQTRIWG